MPMLPTISWYEFSNVCTGLAYSSRSALKLWLESRNFLQASLKGTCLRDQFERRTKSFWGKGRIQKDPYNYLSIHPSVHPSIILFWYVVLNCKRIFVPFLKWILCIWCTFIPSPCWVLSWIMFDLRSKTSVRKRSKIDDERSITVNCLTD